MSCWNLIIEEGGQDGFREYCTRCDWVDRDSGAWEPTYGPFLIDMEAELAWTIGR